jgi:hypothetical protein
MKEETENLVVELFKQGSAAQLMSIIGLATKIKTDTIPFDDLGVEEQAASVVLQVVMQYLTELGVLEDVQV